MEENNDTFLAGDDVLMFLTEQIHKKYYLLLKCFCVTFLVKKISILEILEKSNIFFKFTEPKKLTLNGINVVNSLASDEVRHLKFGRYLLALIFPFKNAF